MTVNAKYSYCLLPRPIIISGQPLCFLSFVNKDKVSFISHGIADVAGDVKGMSRGRSIGFMVLLFGFPLTTGGNDRGGAGGNPWYSRGGVTGGISGLG